MKTYNFILKWMKRIYYFISINGGRSQITKYSCGRSQITKYSCGRSQITRQTKRKKVTKEANYGPSALAEVGATEADSSIR